MFSLPQRLFGNHALAVSHPAVSTNETRTRHTGTRERILLDLVMPQYHFRGGASVTVEATPEEVLHALEEVTLADMPLAHMIGTLWYLPGRLTGKERPPHDQLSRPFLQVATSFLRLGEDPGSEIVIGSAGKFHNLLDQQFVALPDLFTFTRFNDAGYQKLAMNFDADPQVDGTRTRLTASHRTLALSRDSRRKFAVYWYLMIGWGGDFMLRQLLKAIRRRAEAAHRAATTGA